MSQTENSNFDVSPEKTFELPIKDTKARFTLKPPSIRATQIYRRYLEGKAIESIRDHASSYGNLLSMALDNVSKAIARGDFRWGTTQEWANSFNDADNRNYLIFLVIEQSSPGNDMDAIMKSLSENQTVAEEMFAWIFQQVNRPNSQSPQA